MTAALALAPCGGVATESDEVTADYAMSRNIIVNDPAAMNGMRMDANAAMDADTHHAMMKEATINDPDTNLANGM